MTAPARSYAHAVAHFDDLVAAARTTLAGFSACVHVVSPLDDRLLARIREADPGPEARAFAELLLDHAHRGRGGERCADWSRGPRGAPRGRARQARDRRHGRAGRPDARRHGRAGEYPEEWYRS